MEHFLIKLADNSKLETWVDTLKGRAAVQRNLCGVEEWDSGSIMELIKEKCKALSLEGKNHL